MHHTHTHARTRAHTQQPIAISATASCQNSAQTTGYKVRRVDPISGDAISSVGEGEIRMGFVYSNKGSTRGKFQVSETNIRVSEKNRYFTSAVTANQTLLIGEMYELTRPGEDGEREIRVYKVISLWGDSSTPSSSSSSSSPSSPPPPRYTVQKDGKRYKTYFSTRCKKRFIKVNGKELYLQTPDSLTTLSLEVGSSYTFGSEKQINSGSFKVIEISKPKLQGNEPLPPWVWTPPRGTDSKSESRKRKRQN